MEKDKRRDVAVAKLIPSFPTSHCILMSSSNTEQPCFHIVLVRMDNLEIKMHEAKERCANSEGEPELPDWAQATAHISPHSALVALATHPDDPSAP